MSPAPFDLSAFRVVLDLAPAILLSLSIFSSILLSVPPLNRVLRKVGSPLAGFLQLEDLSEYDAKKSKSAPHSVKNILLICVSFIHGAGWCADASYSAMVSGPKHHILVASTTAAAWVYPALRLIMKPPTMPPYFLLTLAAVQMVSLVPSIWADAVPTWLKTIRLAALLAALWMGFSYPINSVTPSPNTARVGEIPSNKFTSPEDAVSLSNWFTFRFMNPLFKVASMKTLNPEDVWQLSPYFKHRNLFSKYISTTRKNPHQSLLRFLLASNSLDLIISFTESLYKSIATFVPSFCLQRILMALESHDPARRKEAYFYALGTFIFHCSFAQLDLFGDWHARRCYERSRGQMFCAIHWKSLKRRDMRGKTSANKSDKEGQEDEESANTADIGRVVNLITGDTYAVAQRLWEFPAIFMAPVRCTIALVFLYSILGWSCFAGVAVVLLAYLVNWPLAKIDIALTRKSWATKDLRMSYVDEFFQSIRFLKYMGWERAWSNKVRAARETELKIRVKQNIIDVLISFIWSWIPSAVVLASFLCYTIVARQPLTVSKAFTSIEVFSLLQGPMTELPDQIFAVLHALVSMRRIETFLAEDEVEDWVTSLKRDTPQVELSAQSSTLPCKVGFESATFQWYAETAKADSTPPTSETSSATIATDPAPAFRLQDISINFPLGKLSLITGATGSGKTSILNALLGEMNRVSGSVFLDKSNHNVAYAAQFPWLEHATIRDNILFRTPFDAGRYDAVLEACALKHDLGIFEAGDMTEIGEKGVSLSGGQRARVALARAVYSRAKVVLLDDPLAAVDMHTANHLVKKCFCGPLMKDRTILLVTHHVSLCLTAAAYIVELHNGSIYRQGSVKELEEWGQLEDVIATEDHPEVPESEPDDDVNEADQIAPDEDHTKAKAIGKLIEDEHRAEGNVTLKTYLTYMRAVGWVPWSLTCILILAMRGVTVGNQFFLARWAQAYTTQVNDATMHIVRALPSTFLKSPFDSLPDPNENVTPWLIIYTTISLSGALCMILYLSIGYWGSLNASRTLFTAMLDRVSRAPTSFFDRIPIGRILNRFTADMGAVDGALMPSVRSAISGTIGFIASFGVIVLVVPRFAPFALAIAAVYIILAPPYVKASRDLRRLESVFLSPAFSGFDELLHGLIHVRAYGMEMDFQERFYNIVDKFQGFDHFYWMANSWMRERYDYLGSIIVYLTTLFALWTHVPEGMTALVIVNAGIFAEASRRLVRVFAQLELDFNSIERIGEYLAVDQEAAAKSVKPPPAYWPTSNGGIEVENLVIKYSPNLPAVLKGISFEVRPREKIGVITRQMPSGKSTLALSLLRILEPVDGRIFLDGIDIGTLGLDDLRGNITIVSQDVALFSGTVRSNLDPFNEHSDEECWNVLERCHLISHSPFRTPAESLVSPSGSSFSAGERQLLALARAMLRNAKFTILDEASSAIDLATDDMIQRTIREEMVDSLVITIAHRLKTVIDYDRILVLDMGTIAEYDTPEALLEKEGGLFREMCMQSADWEEIRAMARRA
ncbi:hypothetical protein M407DRAFT_82489 [Tulasnella calospora MUT 4182]|uniref:Uncharacterized protein n=1 Tax=Tulasnella calospora MUT 4182 TaxID=1051891 RepID=A0A0C3KE14_9AGAM|nr:hypothetical protein M407DRAFT_82489 [Tulasnella calospora MUT 4182]